MSKLRVSPFKSDLANLALNAVIPQPTGSLFSFAPPLPPNRLMASKLAMAIHGGELIALTQAISGHQTARNPS